MIQNAPIPSPPFIPKLSVVRSNICLREHIDRRKHFLACKRLFDIVFSLVFIVAILSWLLPLLCILIKLSSKGPVFFLQKRVGFGGRSFTCYKLRTMIVNSEADLVQASENDKRVTKLGWFLRKSNMDEFPQFLNVLLGDMSIIGPRPHMYADCRNFSALLPGYKFRNMVKPGLTGLAQVKGYHGPTTTRNCVLMRYHWDHYYIRNIGWLLDTKIMLLTIWQRCWAVLRFLLEQSSSKLQQENKIMAG